MKNRMGFGMRHGMNRGMMHRGMMNRGMMNRGMLNQEMLQEMGVGASDDLSLGMNPRLIRQLYREMHRRPRRLEEMGEVVFFDTLASPGSPFPRFLSSSGSASAREFCDAFGLVGGARERPGNADVRRSRRSGERRSVRRFVWVLAFPFHAASPDQSVSLLWVEGLVACFRLPSLPAGAVVLRVPAGAVRSAESGAASEEFRLSRQDAWEMSGGRGVCVGPSQTARWRAACWRRRSWLAPTAWFGSRATVAWVCRWGARCVWRRRTTAWTICWSATTRWPSWCGRSCSWALRTRRSSWGAAWSWRPKCRQRRVGGVRRGVNARDPRALAASSGARADAVRGRDVPVRADVRRGRDDRLAGRSAVCQRRRGAAWIGGGRDGFVGGPCDSV